MNLNARRATARSGPSRASRASTLLGAALALSLASGCGGTTPPTPTTLPNAEVSFDGLHRVARSRMQQVWVKPDLSLAGYSRVHPVPPTIQYRAVRGEGARSRDAFPISDSRKALLERILEEEFRKELARSKYFSLTDGVGPDVVALRSGLADVVSFAPPEPTGRETGWITSIGEATLVLELRDTMSGEVLARAIDRRAPEPTSGAVRNTGVDKAAQVRLLARSWARMLRMRLDQLHETAVRTGP
jgi:hypothetical protein